MSSRDSRALGPAPAFVKGTASATCRNWTFAQELRLGAGKLGVLKTMTGIGTRTPEHGCLL